MDFRPPGSTRTRSRAADAEPALVGPYRVLAYAPEGVGGWTLCGCYFSLTDAQLAAAECRLTAPLSAIALASAGPVPRLRVVEANVPRPDRLASVPEFRRVATAL